MKKLICYLLLLTLALSLCACGGDHTTTTVPETTVAPETTVPETTAAPVDDGMTEYTVKVVDEGGNPVVGAFVQICKDDCFPGNTDENGVATFRRPEAEGYKVSFITVPAGYELIGDQTDFYYEGSQKDMTITIKAVA